MGLCDFSLCLVLDQGVLETNRLQGATVDGVSGGLTIQSLTHDVALRAGKNIALNSSTDTVIGAPTVTIQATSIELNSAHLQMQNLPVDTSSSYGEATVCMCGPASANPGKIVLGAASGACTAASVAALCD
eukprot:m.215347 g.215347  ORF g.215347 m.215347 type:complete len:131 (+) comp19093_c0_seq2:17-409(+)